MNLLHTSDGDGFEQRLNFCKFLLEKERKIDNLWIIVTWQKNLVVNNKDKCASFPHQTGFIHSFWRLIHRFA